MPNQFAPVGTYRLRTVAYGTTPAPCLATTALKVPAEKEQSKFPQAAATLLTDVYVDDILEEIKGLSTGFDIKQSKIKKLALVLDEDNILRVGGRLQETTLTQDKKKHPKLLPAQHRLTKIIMEPFHKKY
ncbi:hypothetical protein AVEN_117263-1 [Araneus ventricosus]|uniref:Reverse transcriptase domain-containing protein n=1 Tax=Araneus ventricosus TaxID=182803 RepID=A0A4Y2AXR1_ARAVE|nr:hypothetical protein AVEN_117263-1 [Araneus ventricosus]